MNVQELINELLKVEDKTKPVWISFDGGLGAMPVGHVLVDSKTYTNVWICEPSMEDKD
jgi:hypothetical protein